MHVFFTKFCKSFDIQHAFIFKDNFISYNHLFNDLGYLYLMIYLDSEIVILLDALDRKTTIKNNVSDGSLIFDLVFHVSVSHAPHSVNY